MSDRGKDGSIIAIAIVAVVMQVMFWVLDGYLDRQFRIINSRLDAIESAAQTHPQEPAK
jgi:hypothetical protein